MIAFNPQKSIYGLTTLDIEKINSVFRNFPEISKVVLYRSRAKGNFRNNSDIDLSVIGDISLEQMLRIETELDNLLLPYEFDVSIFHKIENAHLKEQIDRVGVTFYEKASPNTNSTKEQ